MIYLIKLGLIAIMMVALIGSTCCTPSPILSANKLYVDMNKLSFIIGELPNNYKTTKPTFTANGTSNDIYDLGNYNKIMPFIPNMPISSTGELIIYLNGLTH